MHVLGRQACGGAGGAWTDLEACCVRQVEWGVGSDMGQVSADKAYYMAWGKDLRGAVRHAAFVGNRDDV